MSRRKRKAFTLVELLVVIGIIALLISVLLPTLGKARQQANAVKCLANLRAIGQLMSIYAGENGGLLPYAYYADTSYQTNRQTNWCYTLSSLVNHDAAIKFNAKTGIWKTFRDDPDALIIPERDLTNTDVFVTCYTANPLPFGISDPAWGFYWRPAKLAQFKSQTMAIFDGGQSIDPAKFNATALAAYALDNYQATLNWNAAVGVNSLSGIDRGAADNSTPLVGTKADGTSTSIVNSLRFRHLNNSAVNSLFMDGHAATFKQGELLRSNYRIPPRR